MKLPFGLKAPSKGTLIFSGVAGAISGLVYTSNKHAEESRKKIVQQVSFLAERPCGVLEMPRKVLVYISAPPGDSLEKSRNWFREYVKPVLVAGAVDYEVKEAREAGQIEASVIEEIVKLRRAAEVKEDESKKRDLIPNPLLNGNTNLQQQQQMLQQSLQKKDDVYDGILAIGRNAYREVVQGLSKGCEASLIEPVKQEEEKKVEAPTTVEDISTASTDDTSAAEENVSDQSATMEVATLEDTESTPIVEDKKHFSLPPKFSPIMYIPHVNIIGWSNIPYRLYMWYADYKRIDHVGKYAVAAVLNQTRPVEERDADLGLEEKKYWFGDDEADELKNSDQPIVFDERIMDKLTTYTSDELP